ncbi:MAG: M20/M25/M40 family metallo-hydrolase [Clostridia bacterium]|nr:M20/M25/M40 family metallo-hydrolase [Clostridia bacterium]
MTEKVFRYIEEHEEEYISLLRDIVMLESYTPDKADVDKLAEFIKNFAEKKGLNVLVKKFDKAGNGLLITMNEQAHQLPVAFTGHLDTVHPRGTFADPVCRIEEGKMYGPGTVDMKGGLVIGLMIMVALKECGYNARPIRFIMIPDEELSEGLSLEEGKDFIRNNARGCAAAITLEGGDGKSITVGRKGSIRYKVYIKGKATHAGSAYAQGISAIKEAAHKILDIEAPSDQAQITYNCGMIQGGTSPNTVPGETMFTLYNRYWRLEQRQIIRDHVEGIVAKSYIPGTESRFEIVGERLPMDATEDNYALAAHISGVSEKYGFGALEPKLKSSGSDASYTTMAGAPSVCSVGPSGGRAHSPEEFVNLESVAKRAKMLAAAIIELPEAFPAK